MATSSTYYLNGPSLASATAVFSNAALTTLAPNGFYSDGVISRQQISGALLPQQSCPSCATPCGETVNASGGQGIYLLDLETGTTVADVGAVIVRFDPYGVPDGVRGTLGASVYNKLVSPVDGLHQSSNAGALTYVGQTGADCGISGTTYPALTEFIYNGTTFVATGNTQSVTVAPGDVSLGVSAPGSTMMVIPKLTPTPSIINFEVVGPCSGTAWQMSVACPVLLTGFSSSVSAVSSVAACALSETTTYYNASLNNTPGTVGLYDLVFADAYGQTPLTAGFYRASGSITGGNDWFQVSSAGVVVALGVCAPTSATLSWSFTEAGGSVGTMDLYVNGSIVESRTATSSGTRTVYSGDTINVQVTCDQCTGGGGTYANAYSTGINVASDCSSTGGASIFTSVYTVVSGDLGTTLNLNTFAVCDTACI